MAVAILTASVVSDGIMLHSFGYAEWLGENTELKNMKKHICKIYLSVYREFYLTEIVRQAISCTEMAAIRHYHSLTHSKNILPSNKDLGISEKNDYEFDRAFLPKEFDEMIKNRLFNETLRCNYRCIPR